MASYDHAPVLEGTLHLAAGKTETPLEAPYALLDFVAPNTNCTGLGVSEVTLTGEKYAFNKAARTVLRAGRFEVRCA